VITSTNLQTIGERKNRLCINTTNVANANPTQRLIIVFFFTRYGNTADPAYPEHVLIVDRIGKVKLKVKKKKKKSILKNAIIYSARPLAEQMKKH